MKLRARSRKISKFYHSATNFDKNDVLLFISQGFITVLENATSFIMNLESGVFIVIMLNRARAKKYRYEFDSDFYGSRLMIRTCLQPV